jgi:SET domain-containing protein
MHIIRTPLGGFINHSETPNCIIEKEEDIWYLETTDDITDNEELTVRYFPEFLNF